MFGFGRKKVSAETLAAIDRERFAARDAIVRVYLPNMAFLVADPGRALSDAVLAPEDYDFAQINDMFLRGMLEGFIEGWPPLPNEPRNRVLLHMAEFIADHEEIPFLEGIERAKANEARYNEADPLYDAVRDAGIAAYSGGKDTWLKSAHDQFRAALEARDRRPPLSFEQLMAASFEGLQDPPIPPDICHHYDGIMLGTDNDDPILDFWRREWTTIVTGIAAQGTWLEQRSRFMWHALCETQWAVLWECVTSETTVGSWKSYVENAHNFSGRPDGQLFGVLRCRFMISIPTIAMLQSLGEKYYRYEGTAARSVAVYRRHRKNHLSASINLLDTANKWPAGDTVGDAAYRHKAMGMVPLLNEMHELADRLWREAIRGRMDVQDATTEVADVEARRVAMMKALGL